MSTVMASKFNAPRAVLSGVLRRRWVLAGLLGLWGLVGLSIQAHAGFGNASTLAPDALIGFTYGAAGLWALGLPADRRLGWMLLLAGFVWFAEDLNSSPGRLLGTIGLFTSVGGTPMIGWLALAFPSGRLPGRPERIAVIAGFSAAALVQARVLFTVPVLPGPIANRVYHVPSISPAVLDAWQVVNFVTIGLAIAGVVGLLTRRWLHASRPARRYMLPFFCAVLASSIATVAYVAANDSTKANLPFVRSGQFTTWLVAASFPLGLLRMRLARGSLVGTLTGLRHGDEQRLRVHLAQALDDPDLELRLGFGPVGTPPPGRIAVRLRHDGRDYGVLVTDETWGLDPDLLDAVGAAVGVQVENASLREGRAALVAAADGERRRMERDLHDGAQQRLVVVAMLIGRVRRELGPQADTQVQLAQAELELVGALNEVRAVARGLLPPLLADEGLGAAVRSIAARTPVPMRIDVQLPGRGVPALESTAWFIACEALTNVGKHSQATQIEVVITLEGGSLVLEVQDDGVGGADPGGNGLRGLRARAEERGGRLHVGPRSEGGTLVRAELPWEAS